jgi:predicted  nucleic acid-binding Zn-ribbon protein
MSIDERLQFLLQSTESLHSNMESFQNELRVLKGSVERLHSVVEIDAENIRRLANIAAAHNDNFEDLGSRLDRLERKAKGGA